MGLIISKPVSTRCINVSGKKQTNKKQKLCTVAIYGPRLLFYLHDNYMKQIETA